MKANASVLERHLSGNRFKDAALRRKLRQLAQRDAPSYLKCLGVQDFVFHTGCTVCETTGTGCAAGSNPAKGSGVGCPTNWKMAATTLKMHVAYTAVSIAPRPFSSESARIP